MQQHKYMCTSLRRSNDKGSNPGPAKALAALGFQDIYLITYFPRDSHCFSLSFWCDSQLVAERTQMDQVRLDLGFPKNSEIKDILHVY